jgi:hypothetical protein
LAANNGDTLGEAVISVEVMNSDQNIKKNFSSKQQTEKLYFIIITYLFFFFFSEVLKDANQ